MRYGPLPRGTFQVRESEKKWKLERRMTSEREREKEKEGEEKRIGDKLVTSSF